MSGEESTVPPGCLLGVGNYKPGHQMQETKWTRRSGSRGGVSRKGYIELQVLSAAVEKDGQRGEAEE